MTKSSPKRPPCGHQAVHKLSPSGQPVGHQAVQSKQQLVNKVVTKLYHVVTKGRCHLRFSGIRPLRGYPPPLLTENQSEKKKVFFLSGKGGYPPPLNGKSPKLFREIFS